MPIKIQTTKVYAEVNSAIKKGYTTVSAQGSSRSSKTYNILIFLIIYCLVHPRITLSIVRASLPALRGSVLRDFKEILYRMGIYREKDFNKTELIYTLPSGSIVEFFSTDDEQKLRGRKRHILYVNEANELLFIEFQQLKMRTTLFSVLDYNPSFSEEHWICDLNRDSRTYHFITTYKDNPFLEKTVIEEIESLKTKNKTLWNVYGLGLQAVIEGLIFKGIEIIGEFPEYAKKQAIGMDFGYTNDPSAAIRCGIIDNNLYLDELFYRTHMLAGDIITELKDWRHADVVSDSADPRLIREILNAGINIYPVEKFPGSIMAGIGKMLEFNIKATRRSTNLIKEFRNYTYMQNKEGKFINKPIDAYNHGIDASRYYCLGKLLGKIMLNKTYTKEELGIY